MRRMLIASLCFVVVIVSCAQPSGQLLTVAELSARTEAGSPVVTVFKAPTWGCCGAWTKHLQEHGFTVQAEDVADLAEVKATYAIPVDLQFCHTAIVDGYLIEGHVPAQEIERLLTERPDVVGLAVPGMPIGSPGMEVANAAADPFDVIAYDADGSRTIFASYPE